MKVNVTIIATALFLVCSYAMLPCSAQEVKIGRPPFTTQERFDGYQISSYRFDVSPDGQEMIFIVDLGGYYTELWTAHIDGADARRLHRIEGADKVSPNYEFIFSPKYSPDGNRVGFLKTGSKQGTTLSVLDLATGTAKNVVTAKISPYEIGWKDNSHMYFTKWDRVSRIRTLYQIKIDGTEMKSIVSGKFDKAYSSPDGKKVCLLYRHIVYSPSITGGTKYRDHYTVEMFYPQSMRRVEIIGEDRKFQGHHPVWAPDGSALIFRVSRPHPHGLRIGTDGKDEEIVAEGTVWAWSNKNFILYTREGLVYKRDKVAFKQSKM